MKVIVSNGSLSVIEQNLYKKRIQSMHPGMEIEEIVLDASGEEIQFRAKVCRRILIKQGGSVIGDPMTWNDAKRAEFEETVPNVADDLC